MVLLMSGRIAPFVFLILSLVLIYYKQRMSERGSVPFIRRVPALDAIEEAVGRCAELGRPLLMELGYTDTGLRGQWAGSILAASTTMAYVAGVCARSGVRMIVTPAYPEILPLVYETVKTEYSAAGAIDDYHEDNIIYFSNQQFPWATGVMGTLEREKCGAHIGIGPYHAESLMVAEAGAKVGAMQILGTPRNSQLPFFVACADYTIIGEEVYAIGAYLSKEAGQIGTIAGQDWVKILVIAITIIGILTVSAGSNMILNLLNM